MQRLEVSGAVRPIYGSLGVKRLINNDFGIRDGFYVDSVYVTIVEPLLGIVPERTSTVIRLCVHFITSYLQESRWPLQMKQEVKPLH